MQNYFENPFRGVTLDKQVTNPNIVVGRFSYYSGYYHGHSFDDCARYLMRDEGVDRLLIGSFALLDQARPLLWRATKGIETTGSAHFLSIGCQRFQRLLAPRMGFYPPGIP